MWWIVLLRLAVAAVMVTVIVRLVQVRRREREATERWAMISEVSVGLAEIVRADTTLEDVLRLLVPGFADWCALHLIEDDGKVHRAAVVHLDPQLERRVRARLSEVPFVADAPLGPAKVIRTGEPDLLHDASTQGQLLAGQVDPVLLSDAGMGSRISVPLRARQKTIGALSLHRRAVRAYDEGDVEWAQELARRIAMSIENARLYADARRLFEQSASANWVTTSDGRILACNQMFAQLLGFDSIDAVLNTPAADLYDDPDERDRLLDELRSQRRIAGREASFKRHDDGRTVFALVHAFGEF